MNKKSLLALLLLIPVILIACCVAFSGWFSGEIHNFLKEGREEMEEKKNNKISQNVLKIYDNLQLGMNRETVENVVSQIGLPDTLIRVGVPGHWDIGAPWGTPEFSDTKQVYLLVVFSNDRVSAIKIRDNETNETPGGYPPAKEVKHP